MNYLGQIMGMKRPHLRHFAARAASVQDIKAAKALLDTPITELKFDIRSQRIISEADIKTLRELLQITSQYGFRKLRDMLRNFGLVSQKKVEKRLKELNVLDVAGNCNLYRYLDE